MLPTLKLIKKSKKRLLNYNKELKSKIDIISKYVMYSETDLKGTITYASDLFCKTSQYKREELIGQNHRIVKHPDMKNEIFEDLWRTISSGRIWHGEVKNRKRTGSTTG